MSQNEEFSMIGKNDKYTDFIMLHLRWSVYEQQVWGDRMAVKDAE
jgi:hypothetical protein